MNELYSNETNVLTFSTSVKGEHKIPTSLPIAKLWTSNTKDFIGTPNDLTVFEEDSVYKVLVPSNLISNKRWAKVVFEYDLLNYGFNALSEIYELDARLITLEELNNNLGVDSTGESYEVSYWQYDKAEKVVRKIINTFCQQRFNSWIGSRKVTGSNSDIYLPQHMEKLTGVASGYTDINFFDNYNVGDYVLSDSGKVLSIGQPWIKPSVIYKKYQSKQLYLVTGIWGYLSVPEAVKEATLELVRFFMSDDVESRRNYFLNVNSDSNSSYTFNFSAYRDSTGNPVADELLSNYRIYNVSAV